MQQGNYPIGSRVLAGTDTVTGVVTGATADIPISAIAAYVAKNGNNGGTTAARPASPGLYQPYFDTTLGQPIWCSQITPSIIWVNAAGVAV